MVLPFSDSSSDHDEGHFADGITEDLITELARSRWLSVIARNSAFAYKGRSIDVKQISKNSACAMSSKAASAVPGNVFASSRN